MRDVRVICLVSHFLQPCLQQAVHVGSFLLLALFSIGTFPVSVLMFPIVRLSRQLASLLDNKFLCKAVRSAASSAEAEGEACNLDSHGGV